MKKARIEISTSIASCHREASFKEKNRFKAEYDGVVIQHSGQKSKYYTHRSE